MPTETSPIALNSGGMPPARKPYDTTSDIEAAMDMPNIDGRPSVFADLPKDLFLDEREFAVQEEEGVEAGEVRFGKPGSQDIVHCHPDPNRKKVVRAIRDKRNNRGGLFVVTESLVKQNPRLLPQCKTFVLRQYVTLGKETGVWAAPLPGPKEAPSDASHLQAQEASMTSWVRLEWDNASKGGRYRYYEIDDTDLGAAQFPPDTFEEVLAKGLSDYVISDREHPLCKYLLMGVLGSTAE